MIKSNIFRFIVVLAAILQAVCMNAQVLSQAQKKLLTEGFDKHIKTVSAISAENIDMISVYRYQLEKAEQFAEENERYSADKDIYAKLFELKNLVEQNKEVVDFLAPRASRMYYSKAISLLSDGKTNEAYTCLHKAVAVKPDNIMAHYELCK
ncbi:MAG: hypothetical protein IJ250_07230, partial [Bacteroidales bacterium]|nr:hypothetical protein [Bacteroidales bacterium]